MVTTNGAMADKCRTIPTWPPIADEIEIVRARKAYTFWEKWKLHCWKSVDTFRRADEAGEQVTINGACGGEHGNTDDQRKQWQQYLNEAQIGLDFLAARIEEYEAKSNGGL